MCRNRMSASQEAPVVAKKPVGRPRKIMTEEEKAELYQRRLENDRKYYQENKETIIAASMAYKRKRAAQNKEKDMTELMEKVMRNIVLKMVQDGALKVGI